MNRAGGRVRRDCEGGGGEPSRRAALRRLLRDSGKPRLRVSSNRVSRARGGSDLRQVPRASEGRAEGVRSGVDPRPRRRRPQPPPTPRKPLLSSVEPIPSEVTETLAEVREGGAPVGAGRVPPGERAPDGKRGPRLRCESLVVADEKRSERSFPDKPLPLGCRTAP